MLSTGGLPVDKASGPVAIVFATLGIAVLAPICEEIFFRGVMFGSLRRWKGVWVAATITAIAFSAAHLEFAPVIFADRLIAGFVWSLVYARTGRLLPGMMAHAANNAVVIGLLLGWDWQIPLLVAACVGTVTLVVSPFAQRPGRACGRRPCVQVSVSSCGIRRADRLARTQAKQVAALPASRGHRQRRETPAGSRRNLRMPD